MSILCLSKEQKTVLCRGADGSDFCDDDSNVRNEQELIFKHKHFSHDQLLFYILNLYFEV